MITAPFMTLSTAGALLAMSKLLRTKAFLSIITRPTGIRPGAAVDYDKVGRALEAAWEIVGQVGAQGASQGAGAAEQRIQRELTQGVPQVQMPRGAPQFQFTPPPRLQPSYNRPQVRRGQTQGAAPAAPVVGPVPAAPGPQPSAQPARTAPPSLELLGSNPFEALRNLGIAQRPPNQ